MKEFKEFKEEFDVEKEIDALLEAEKERKEKGEEFNPRLAVIDKKDLTDEDKEMFRKFKQGVWTAAEFKVYTDNVSNDLKEKPNNSRDNLRDWLATKAQIQFSNQE